MTVGSIYLIKLGGLYRLEGIKITLQIKSNLNDNILAKYRDVKITRIILVIIIFIRRKYYERNT
jgi:hypothetical protein